MRSSGVSIHSRSFREGHLSPSSAGVEAPFREHLCRGVGQLLAHEGIGGQRGQQGEGLLVRPVQVVGDQQDRAPIGDRGQVAADRAMPAEPRRDGIISRASVSVGVGSCPAAVRLSRICVHGQAAGALESHFRGTAAAAYADWDTDGAHDDVRDYGIGISVR